MSEAMAYPRKTGKREARHDARVRRLSVHKSSLAPPPPSANWYADVPSWGMLGNNKVGNCVQAGVLHLILQHMCYVQAPIAPSPPTDEEAIAFYSGSTGFVPGNPLTDNGSYVLGPSGVMEYWLNKGVMCGGVLNKPTAFLAISHTDPVEWQQAISTFSNMLTGIQIPKSIVEAEDVPYLWEDYTGPSAGGHEILLVGYQKTASTVLYNLVSWGQIYQATQEFLMRVIDEAVTVLNPAFINKDGVNPAGIPFAALQTTMTTFSREV